MLRRALLLLLLAAPLGALAQVTFEPAALGKSDCGGSGRTLTINWTSTVNSGAAAFIAGTDLFRIQVSLASGCPTGSTTKALVADQVATALTQNYQLKSTDFLNTLSSAGLACGTTETVYVCVSLYASAANGSALKGNAVTGSIDYDVTPPPIPVNVSVSPGDSALYVSWGAGTGSSVAADHYDVTMTVETNAIPPDPVTTHPAQSFTGTSGRYTGLVNGVTYSATVVAVSAGGNASLPSAAATGTPKPVSDYWTQYQAQGGLDPGGCAGGPAGVLSLLGLAGLARTFRRRS